MPLPARARRILPPARKRFAAAREGPPPRGKSVAGVGRDGDAAAADRADDNLFNTSRCRAADDLALEDRLDRGDEPAVIAAGGCRRLASEGEGGGDGFRHRLDGEGQRGAAAQTGGNPTQGRT